MVISLGQLPSAGCDQNHIRSLSGVKWKASARLRNLGPQHPTPSPNPSQTSTKSSFRRPGREGSPLIAALGRLHKQEGRSGFSSSTSPTPPNSAFLPVLQWRGKLPEDRPAHSFCPCTACPPETKSSGHDCQVPLSNLVDILIEERIPRGPPAEMPHVRERLFSFPFAVNEFYSWQRSGAGSHPHRS